MRLERIALAILLLGGVVIAATITNVGPGATTAAGGADTDIQFNSGGALAGNDNLVYIETATANNVTLTDPNSASVVQFGTGLGNNMFIEGDWTTGLRSFELNSSNGFGAMSLSDGLGNDVISCNATNGQCTIPAIRTSPLASPPFTCEAAAEGAFYSDTSHALCWCDGTTWQKISGAGTCS